MAKQWQMWHLLSGKKEKEERIAEVSSFSREICSHTQVILVGIYNILIILVEQNIFKRQIINMNAIKTLKFSNQMSSQIYVLRGGICTTSIVLSIKMFFIFQKSIGLPNILFKSFL